MPVIEVKMPKYPECWESCGSCAQGEVFILEVFAVVGNAIQFDEPILTLETGKVSLDIPSPVQGIVESICVDIGDRVEEGALLITVTT